MSSPKERNFVAALKSRPEIGFFLIFGQDESAVADIAGQMAVELGPNAERIDIDSDRIKNDPALLSDEAAALSLFGDMRYVRLNFRREEGIAAIENLLSLTGRTNPVIATAGNLPKTSKLRKLAESHPRALAHICYLPEEGDFVAAILSMATTRGLKLDRALASRISRYTSQDRRLAAAEIDKLALYYDSSPERPALVDMSIFEALSAETGEENVSGLINQIMSGELRKVGVELAAARDVGVDSIRIVRALQRRVGTLASLRAKVDNGASPAAVVKATRSIFYKEAEAFVRQLSRWPSIRLAGLNRHLIEVEEQLMSVKEALGQVILEEELVRITRAAARLG